MALALKPGEMQQLQDKLRLITDDTWIREGSTLKACTPQHKDGTLLLIQNLEAFDLYPTKRETGRGTVLTLDLEEAYDTLSAVSVPSLRSWAKGEG